VRNLTLAEWAQSGSLLLRNAMGLVRPGDPRKWSVYRHMMEARTTGVRCSDSCKRAMRRRKPVGAQDGECPNRSRGHFACGLLVVLTRRPTQRWRSLVFLLRHPKSTRTIWALETDVQPGSTGSARWLSVQHALNSVLFRRPMAPGWSMAGNPVYRGRCCPPRRSRCGRTIST